MGNAFEAPEAISDEIVVRAESGVLRRELHLLAERFRIPLRLGVAEMLRAVEVDFNQVTFRIMRELNLPHATSLFGAPLDAPPLAFGGESGH